jgi:hypothetical protein
MIITEFEDDIPTTWVDGDTQNNGVYVADDVGVFALRRFDNELIDVSKNTSFFICNRGLKHIEKLETDWQELECNFKDTLIKSDDVWVVLDNQMERRELLQYIAIDQHIQSKIKTRDFDDIGQIALCCVDGNGYQVEALAVSAWVRKCWYIQEQIKLGELVFDSVEAAIAELPPFDIAH